MISYYKYVENEELQNSFNTFFGPFKNIPSYGRGFIGHVEQNGQKIDSFVFHSPSHFFSEQKIIDAKISNHQLQITSDSLKENIKIFVSYEYL